MKPPSHSKQPTAAWHLLTAEETSRNLEADALTGLTVIEAEQRLALYGRNVLQEKQKRSLLRMLFDQFADFMILVLICAAIISGVIGDVSDTIAIIVIVFLNAVIGFVQEYRAERAIAALKAMAAVSAKIRRDGEIITLPASELVPGDMVLLEAGNVIPADLRLLQAVRLKVDEATLTGESLTVEKHTLELNGQDLSLGDRKNLAYKGTVVTYGMVVGHVAPEAAVGGNIALVQEGDSITIDAEARLLQLNVPDEELVRRRAQWKPPAPRYTRGVLAKYAKLVSSASLGAVTD